MSNKIRINAQLKNMPLELLKIINNANATLNCGTTTYRLEKTTGINHAAISRLRNGKLGLTKIALKTLIKLASYPDMSIASYYFKSIDNKINAVLDMNCKSIKLSRILHIGRDTVYKLRRGTEESVHYKIENLRLKNVAKFINYYDKSSLAKSRA